MKLVLCAVVLAAFPALAQQQTAQPQQQPVQEEAAGAFGTGPVDPNEKVQVQPAEPENPHIDLDKQPDSPPKPFRR